MQTSRWGWALRFLVCCGLLAGAVNAFAAGEGDPMPAMKLLDVSTGADMAVSEHLAGSVGAIVYMQTSCAACRKELIALKEISAKYPGLKIIAISVDSGNPARVKRYQDHFGFDFPFLHDPDFATPELFEFSFTPALVLVDKAGKIAQLKGGYRPGDEVALEEKIAALLGP